MVIQWTLNSGLQMISTIPHYTLSNNSIYIDYREDGTRVFRMGNNDITGKHGGGPHVNLETLIENPNKPGKMKVETNIHVFRVH